jgi:hypothetical protein
LKRRTLAQKNDDEFGFWTKVRAVALMVWPSGKR